MELKFEYRNPKVEKRNLGQLYCDLDVSKCAVESTKTSDLDLNSPYSSGIIFVTREVKLRRPFWAHGVFIHRSKELRCSVNRLIPIVLSTLMLVSAGTANAFVTPFGIRVNDAIERGLDYFRSTQEGNGGWGEATGLVLLCFLEQSLRLFQDFSLFQKYSIL